MNNRINGIPFPSRRFQTASLLALATFATHARAQDAPTWTVINLHPAGAGESRLYDTTGTEQVGTATFATLEHGARWSGSAASFVDLNPPGATRSVIHRTRNSQQAGLATLNGQEIAVIWTGTPVSAISLHPSGPPPANTSAARGTTGTQQCGSVRRDQIRASLWSGSATSLVDLHPAAGVSASVALATNGSRQVGAAAIVGGDSHAAVWAGSADSFRDLNPTGAVSSSISAIEESQKSDAQMVGYAQFGNQLRAGLWTGTRDSFVNLNPIVASESFAEGTDGVHQVGRVRVDGLLRAALWRGTADSFVDLHALLPAGYIDSFALAVWSDGVTTLVAGSAKSAATNRYEAMLWKLAPEPEPSQRNPEIFLQGKTVRTTSAARLTVRGTARDADRVEVRMGQSRYRAVRGTAAWTHRARLEPGRNRFVFRAVDSAGVPSRTLRVNVIRQ